MYLLLAEPVESIIHNCFKESDIVIQLSRIFPILVLKEIHLVLKVLKEMHLV